MQRSLFLSLNASLSCLGNPSPARAIEIRDFDLLGFQSQLVFSTFAPGQFLSKDLDVLYGGVRAHTRALADFCSADQRLLSVPLIPWSRMKKP